MGNLTPRRKSICVTLSASLYQALVLVAFAQKGSRQKMPSEAEIEEMQRMGLAEIYEDGNGLQRIKLTPAGWLLAENIPQVMCPQPYHDPAKAKAVAGNTPFSLSWDQEDLFPCGGWGSAPRALGAKCTAGSGAAPHKSLAKTRARWAHRRDGRCHRAGPPRLRAGERAQSNRVSQPLHRGAKRE